jgi:hypothetical protein
MAQKISQHMIEFALGSIDHDVNITQLSRMLGINTSTLWFKISGKRKWDVESWLDLLCATGNMKIEKGKIVIKTNIPEAHVERFKSIHKRYV